MMNKNKLARRALEIEELGKVTGGESVPVDMTVTEEERETVRRVPR